MVDQDGRLSAECNLYYGNRIVFPTVVRFITSRNN